MMIEVNNVGIVIVLCISFSVLGGGGILIIVYCMLLIGVSRLWCIDRIFGRILWMIFFIGWWDIV